MGWTLKEFGFNSQQELRDISVVHSIPNSSGAHPASCLLINWWLIPLGLKQQKLEADCSPPSHATVTRL
jgi:hypothetical protein